MPTLIGRLPELARIDAAIARREALPAGLVIHGRAGIGKTALWREAVERAAAGGFRVLACALTRHESRLPYAGLADLIGPTIDEVLLGLPPRQAHALQAAVALAAADDAPTDERAVAFALSSAISRLARDGPVAIAIDDVQWLDASSALMLSYALRRLRAEPVLLLITRRDGEPPGHQISITEGSSISLEPLVVGPLPMGAIHRLIRTRLGASLPRPQLLRVHAASNGNALHALELARAMGPGGGAREDEVTSLLRDRIRALPERAREALGFAAVASARDVGELVAGYGSSFQADLRPAIEAEFINVEAGEVQFGHPLVAVAAEASLAPRRRAEFHRRLAAASPSPAARATHLAAAADEPDAEVAAALDAAARDSRRIGARAVSASLFESAGRMTPSADAPAGAVRLLRAAEAWHDAGDVRHAEEILVELMDRLPSGDLRWEAAWRLGVLRDDAGSWRDAMELWREALGGAVAAGLRSRILGSLAITTFYTGSATEAVDIARAAVEAAEGSPEPVHLARALAVEALTLAMSGGEGGQPLIARALELEAALDEPLGDWSPSAVAAEVARHVGDVAGAERHYAAVLAAASERGDANQEQWAAYGLATALMLSGDVPRASELADSVLDLADQTGQMRIPAKVLRAHVDASLGDLDSADRLVRSAIDDAVAAEEATHLFGATVVLAAVEHLAGRADAALRAYADARRIAGDVGLRHATAIRTFLAEAELAAAAGRADQARAAMGAFEHAVEGRAPTWVTPLLARARASIRSSEGDFDGARRLLIGAAEDGLPLDRARALLALGTVERRTREHAHAREHLGWARDLFVVAGARMWARLAEQELARIPGRRARQQGGLTEAEEGIAALVAQGRSNREVAAALFVSVKTVEAALTRIYEKVGVRTRSELAHVWSAAAKH